MTDVQAKPITPELYARLGPLLDHALSLPPNDRAAWLATRSGETTLVIETLAMLLKRDAVTNPLLPSGPGKYSLGQLLGTQAASMVGTRIGPWTLDEPIGQGGMGAVWLAHRVDGTFEGHAAIKLLHMSQLNQLALERFRAEATALATMAHLNVARLLDAGVTDAGQPYLVMEYVEGEPLDVYVARCQPSERARLELVQQILDAISHAHAHLIVHRDLKPSNILVRSDGRAILLDFGIAKQLMGAEGIDPGAVTEVGGRALTPLYASPEQLRGDAIGTASDVYSAAVVAYVMLTGQHPTADQSASTADITRTTLDVEPRRTSLGDLDTILRKALKKLPAERYETAAAFNDDVRRYLQHEPVRARPDTLRYRTRRFVRRNRVAVAGLSIAVLALATTTGVAIRQAQHATTERDRALFQSERAEATRQLQTVLLSQIGTTPLDMRQLLDRGVQMFESGHTTDPRITTALFMNFADRYGELALPEQAQTLLWRADSAAQTSNDAATTYSAACALALHYAEAQKTDTAQSQLSRGATIDATSTGAIGDVDRVTCLLASANLFDQRNVNDSALVLVDRAIMILDGAGRSNTLQMIGVRARRAGLLSDLSRAREAVDELERQQNALTQMGLGGSAVSTAVLANITNARSTLGERAAVLVLLREVNARLAAADSASGVNPVTGFNFAAELLADGQIDSALVWYRAVERSSAKRSTPVVESRALFGVVRSLAALGRGTAAQPQLLRYLAMLRALKRPTFRDSLILTAFVSAANRDTVNAVSLLERVMVLDSVLIAPPTTRKSWTAMRMLTPLLLSQRTPERAQTYARLLRRIADTDSLTATRSADVGLADLYLARAFAAQGMRDSARVWASAAQFALRAGAGAGHAHSREADALLATLR